MDNYVQLPTAKGPCFINVSEIACIHPTGMQDTYVFIKGQPKPIVITENTQAVFMLLKEANNEGNC